FCALSTSPKAPPSLRVHYVPHRFIRARNPTQHRQHHSLGCQHGRYAAFNRASWVLFSAQTAAPCWHGLSRYCIRATVRKLVGFFHLAWTAAHVCTHH